MNNRYPRTQGFTLIELMITIVILSLLLFTGSYTYSILAGRWDKELGQFSQSASTAKHLELIQRLLEGVQPFVVVDGQSKPSHFFIGGNDSLLAVSRAGLFSGDYPEIFRLSTVANEDGSVDLVYQSASTQRVLLTGTEQAVSFNRRLTLFSDMERVTFRYFGWSHYLIKSNAEQNGDTPKWFERFSGIDNQMMPEQITLELLKAGQSLSIPITLPVGSERWLSPYLDEGS